MTGTKFKNNGKDGSPKLRDIYAAAIERGWKSTLKHLQVFTKLPVWMSCLLLFSASISSFSGVGSYLNQYFFFNPVYKLRASTGHLQKLDSKIKLVLVEDRSMRKIGRFPTLEDWQEIAGQLFEAGVEKVFLLGLHDLDSEVGQVKAMLNAKGQLIASAARNDIVGNLRAVQATDIPQNLLLAASDGSVKGLVEAGPVITQNASSYLMFDRIGHANLKKDGSHSFDIAYSAGANAVLPNMAFYILDNLSWKNGSLHAGDREIPVSSDQTMMIDYLDPDSMIQNSLPVSAFYAKDKNFKEVTATMSGALKDKLVGVKYVVLIKEAYQGSRFIEAPFGNVPSYASIISPMNSVLQEHFVYRPIEDFKMVFGIIPLFVLLLCSGNIQIALMGTFGSVLLVFSGSAWLMTTKGWLFPGAEMAVLGLIGWLVRLFHYTLQVLQEKLTLNRDLEMGRTVQGLFLPGDLRGSYAGWEFKFLFHPYGAMSGDWVHVYQSPAHLPKPFAVFAIGDVVGKGPSAALNTAVIAGIWHHFTEEWDRGKFSMEDFIKQLNRIIRQTFRSNQNTTISIAYVSDDEVLVASCGAPTWIRVHPGNSAGSVRSAPYDPIGMQPSDVEVNAVRILPQRGEVFIAHTDGVMEGSKVRKAFLKTMTTFADGATDQVFDGIEKIARQLGQDEVLPDDFTMLMIRRTTIQMPTDSSHPTQVAA